MLIDVDGDGWTLRTNGLFDRDDRPAGSGWMSKERLAEAFGPLRQTGAWDEDMTPAERAAAIKAEVEKAESERGNAPLPATWSDPRTANFLGNYVTG